MTLFSWLPDWLLRRRRAIIQSAHVVVPLGLLFLAVSLRVAPGGIDEEIRNKAFDTFLRIKPRPYQSVPVRVIDIDDESLAKLGQWPWPRNLVARMVARLRDRGAAVVAFDAVFSEPDRTSPSKMLSLWQDVPGLEGLRDTVKLLPDHDRMFAKAIAGANVVTGFVLTGEKNDKVPLSKAAFAYAGDGPLAYLPDYTGAVPDLPILEKAAAGNGFFSFVPDRDGIVRRAPMIAARGQTLLPSLSAEALRVAQGARNYAVKSSGARGELGYGGTHTGIVSIKVGHFVVPTDGHGETWVYYTAPAPERTIPVWKIFEKGFDGGGLDGAIVFVGTSAAGLKDLRATPLNPAAPGVEVHANIAEQVLLHQFLQRPDWADGAEILYMVFLGVGLLALLPYLGAALCAVVGIGGIVAAVALSWHAYTAWHYLLDPVFPSLTVLLVYMSSSLISYLRSEAERRQVKGAFSRYMSPSLVQQLADHPERLKLGGEARMMTFHFCDIEGFTTISEFYEPDGLIRFLNRFLTPMTEIILNRHGTIDKYIGDCIMAFWNAPLDDPEHAKHACLAVLEMHAALKALNEERRVEAEASGKRFIPIRIRTGLNTGNCIVGNMGSEQRFDYSVISDDVNLASRLEGANKYFGTYIMVSEATFSGAAAAVEGRELGRVLVVGKAQPIRVYELLAKKGELSPDWAKALPRYAEGLEQYRARKFESAAAAFSAVLEAFPKDGPAAMYARLSAEYAAAGPPSDWDDVIHLKSK